MPIRILVVDDHPMMSGGLRRLLEKFPGVEVAGEARDGKSALDAAIALSPDLVLTDLSMPGFDGFELVRRLQIARPDIRVIVLSIHDEPKWVSAALKAGAVAYVTKMAVPEELQEAISAVLEGKKYVKLR